MEVWGRFVNVSPTICFPSDGYVQIIILFRFAEQDCEPTVLLACRPKIVGNARVAGCGVPGGWEGLILLLLPSSLRMCSAEGQRAMEKLLGESDAHTHAAACGHFPHHRPRMIVDGVRRRCPHLPLRRASRAAMCSSQNECWEPKPVVHANCTRNLFLWTCAVFTLSACVLYLRC